MIYRVVVIQASVVANDRRTVDFARLPRRPRRLDHHSGQKSFGRANSSV